MPHSAGYALGAAPSGVTLSSRVMVSRKREPDGRWDRPGERIGAAPREEAGPVVSVGWEDVCRDTSRRRDRLGYPSIPSFFFARAMVASS